MVQHSGNYQDKIANTFHSGKAESLFDLVRGADSVLIHVASHNNEATSRILTDWCFHALSHLHSFSFCPCASSLLFFFFPHKIIHPTT